MEVTESVERMGRVEASEHSGLLTVNEAVRYLSISRTTLYRLIDRGEIPIIRLSKDPRFLRSDLDSFIRSKREEVTFVGGERRDRGTGMHANSYATA